MSADQSARLPELLAHYREHQREAEQSLSFWTFMVDHYASDSQPHKAPPHCHHHLPSFDGGTTAFVFSSLFAICFELPFTEPVNSAFFRVPVLYARQFYASLLQPPRA